MSTVTEQAVPGQPLGWTQASDSEGVPTLIRVGAQERVSYMHHDLTPLKARRMSLSYVMSALDAAKIDHFAIRGMDDRNGGVGVRLTDRTAVLAVLERLARSTKAYVSLVIPRPPTGGNLLPPDEEETWRQVAGATVINLTWFHTDPAKQLVLGKAYGCDIEFWRLDRTRHELVAPRPNRMVRAVAAGSPTIFAGEHRFTRLVRPQVDGLQLRTKKDFDNSLPDDVEFPIDLVYTWVDGTDLEWQRKRASAAGKTYHLEADNEARYINRDELRYSLRSMHMNMPWIHDIYIVTDNQVPSWLDTSHPRIHIVDHTDIFEDPTVLPVFNSCAIESQLHRIDRLSEYFIYMNDDMFIGVPLAPQTFFLAHGISKFFFSQNRIPLGPRLLLDTPVDAMIKNGRDLIEKRFGRVLTQGTQHVPYALRRSVLAELEREFPSEYKRTAASRFRSPEDLTVTYSLYHYYAFLTGRAIPGQINYGYVQLAVPDLAARLQRALTRRDWGAFCINDAFSSAEEVERQLTILKPFLESYFPTPSPYEKQP